MTRQQTEAERAAWEKKASRGPYGLLLIHASGGGMITPRQLLTELGSNVVAALMAALLLVPTRLGFVGRVGFVTLLGLVGWVSLSISYWNWYGFPTPFIAAEGMTEGIGWLLVGLALAAIVRPARAVQSSGVSAV
jgi:hypothetical protein